MPSATMVQGCAACPGACTQEEGGSGMSSTQVVVHSSVPYALGWGQCIAAAGNDNKVSPF